MPLVVHGNLAVEQHYMKTTTNLLQFSICLFSFFGSINQNCELHRTAFVHRLNPPTLPEVSTNLIEMIHDWLVFVRVVIAVLIDGSKTLQIVHLSEFIEN